MNDDTTFSSGGFFSDRPAKEALPLGLPVVRAPQKGQHALTLLSDSVIGCWTHFYRGRTQPCLGDVCTICPQEITRRWHGWVVGYDPIRRSRCIVELTAGPALHLSTYRDERGSLRGCSLILQRKNGKLNGPVQAGIAGPKGDISLLPECPLLPPMLLRMWQIKGCDSPIAIDDEPRVYPGDDGDYDGVAVPA